MTTTGVPPSGLLSPTHRALSIGLILVVTLAAFESLAVATAMPVVEEDLGGIRLYGLVFAGFMVGNLVGTAFAGIGADTGPPVRPFVIGITTFTLGLLLGGLAPAMEFVVAARVIQGFGSGCNATIAYVAIGRGYDDALRPRMFAALSSAWVVPGLIGPALSGAIAENLSWRLVFLGLVPFLMLSAALTVPAIRRLDPGTGAEGAANTGRLARAIVVALGAAAALIGSTLSEPVPAVLMIAGGGVVAAAGLYRLLPAGTFSAASGLPASVAGMGLTCLAFFGAEAFLPFTLTETRGVSPAIAGLSLTAASITWALGSWVQAHRAEVWSKRSMVVSGCLMVALGISMAASTASDGVPVPMAAVGWGVSGFGMGLAYTTISVAILEQAPSGQTGYASASLQQAMIAGVVVGTGVSGAIVGLGDAAGWDTAASLGVAFGLMTASALLASVVGLRVPGTVPNEPGLAEASETVSRAT